MASLTEITPAQLMRLIGTANCPVIIDVRTDEDFNDQPFYIPTAIRHAFTDITNLVPQLKNKSVVVYCKKGLKISQGAVALLRSHGVQAENLEGGQFRWRDEKLPMISAQKLSTIGQQGSSLWVSKHRPKVDRIACPWLIRRFIDPNARFLFVNASQVLNVAEKFAAIPFDIDDVFWSHRGDQCTFDTFIKEFELQSPALDRLAQIIRGADTNQLNIAPESAGLLAISLGLSRMHKDDLLQLEAGMDIYDAFYRWSRDAVSEKHVWP